MKNLLRILARPTNAPRSAQVTETPSMVVHIGPVYWTVKGFGCVLTALSVIVTTFFFCALVGILLRLLDAF